MDVVKTDLQALNQNFLNQKHHQIDTEYRLYPNFLTQKTVDVMQAATQRVGNQLYHQLGNIESITNGGKILVVDHDDKTIFLDQHNSSLEQTLIGYDVEQALAFCESTETILNKPTEKAYRLRLMAGEYEQMDIHFIPSSFLFKKVVLYYREPQKLTDSQVVEDQPRMEIIFQKMDIQNPPNPIVFKESKFIRTVKGEIIPTGKYKDYRVLNNRLQNPLKPQK